MDIPRALNIRDREQFHIESMSKNMFTWQQNKRDKKQTLSSLNYSVSSPSYGTMTSILDIMKKTIRVCILIRGKRSYGQSLERKLTMNLKAKITKQKNECLNCKFFIKKQTNKNKTKIIKVWVFEFNIARCNHQTARAKAEKCSKNLPVANTK